MRYFDDKLVANSRHHAEWWEEVGVARNWFHHNEQQMAALRNQSSVLPRDAWLEFDNITRRIMRDDEGQVYMTDLMPLARPVDIGKLVHMTRVSSDAGKVVRSVSGQVPVELDKVVYDYRGTPVTIFSTAFGREWREWSTMTSENFDALSDDAEAHNAVISRDQADYALDGDPEITIKGYSAYGIRTSEHSKAINLGSAAGGANIDLTSATPEAVEAFFNGPFGAMLDNNQIAGGVNLYISPEIGRNFDRPYSGADGFKGGSLLQVLLANRRINKIAVTFKLNGNEFFSFVPNGQYIRPLIGMAVNTTPMARLNPTDNYQFLIMGAMGIEVRSDWSGKSGVFYSEVQN